MKCVGTPMSFRFWKTNSEMRLLRHALAVDHLMLLRIEGGRVVLEMLNKRTRFGSFIENLCLTLVNASGGDSWGLTVA